MFIHRLFLTLPPSMRDALKRGLRSSGHSSSLLDPLTARKDALGKKRLDRSLKQIVNILGIDGSRLLNGRVCVDFGAGYVPMDAISMWLLGADSVIAVDYNDIASFRALQLGITKSDFSVINDLLRKVAPPFDWAGRLELVAASIADRPSETLSNKIPFRYLAPLDILTPSESIPEFDFVWSISVLEHIPPSELVPVLGALKGRSASNALHVHRVDLRDHRDFDQAPYDFLDPDAGFNPETQADSRGNGMTLDAWESLLASHPELQLRVAAVERGRPNLVPIDSVTGKPVISRVADYVTIATSSFPSLLPPSP